MGSFPAHIHRTAKVGGGKRKINTYLTICLLYVYIYFFFLHCVCLSILGLEVAQSGERLQRSFGRLAAPAWKELYFGSRYWFYGTLPRVARNPEGCQQKPVIAVKSRHQGHQGIAATTSNRCVLFIPQQLSMVPIHHPSNINATLSGFQFSRCSL